MACTVCYTGKAEDQCARCGVWICFDHAYCRGERDDVSEELYCRDCASEYNERIREHLQSEKTRIVTEEADRARKDWGQFFPSLARMELRLMCATLVAVVATKEKVKAPGRGAGGRRTRKS